MRRLFVVAGLALFAVPQAAAQNPQRGTWELGGFGRFNWYDESFSPDPERRENSWGFGFRIARFFSPKWSLEFDASANPTDLDLQGAESVGTIYLPMGLRRPRTSPLPQEHHRTVGGALAAKGR